MNISKVYDDKCILITGGTGTFGKNFISYLFKNHNPRKVIVYSRDEMKQYEMAKNFDDSRIRFFLGDVRDHERLKMALRDVDILIHAAATKIVMAAEYNPFECIKTNVIGAMNVINASIENGVKKVVALSTDKASSPINLYGASKLASDKLFIASNQYTGQRGTCFSIVRYGNVMGSRGSLLQYLKEAADDDFLKLTDPRMTRFMIEIADAIRLVNTAIQGSVGGEVYVAKLKSMFVSDIFKAIYPNKKVEIVGIRPGEKLNEQMIAVEDAPCTYDAGLHYEILPIPVLGDDLFQLKKINLTPVSPDFCYASNTNDAWMQASELISWFDNDFDKLIM